MKRVVAALASYAILDSEAEVEFDQIVAAASAVCCTPIAQITFLDHNHQWCKAETGLGSKKIPLSSSICAYTVKQHDVLVIPDTTRDVRTATNPLVTSAPHVRFYAGVPLMSSDGIALGALCVLDTKPNQLNDAQTLVLRTLARQVMTALELRRTIRSDQRSRAILESAIDYGIIAIDRDGQVTSWNTGAENIFGWSDAEMRGKPVTVFFTEQDVKDGIPEREMTTALQQGRAADKRWHIKKDGTRFWADGEMMPLTDANGASEGFIKILRDCTEQRKTAIKQEADAEFMASVLASSADCIKVLDLDAKLTFMTERGMEVMEISNFNDVNGCPWPDFWVGQGHIEVLAALDAARGGGVGHFQGEANTCRGTPRWWDVQVTPILGADGRPKKLLAVSRDISGQKAVEIRLATSEARWRGLFDDMREGFFLAELIRDAEGRAIDYRFLEINPAFALQSGLPADSTGKTIRNLVPDIAQSLIDDYAHAVETGEPMFVEIEVPVLSRVFEIRASREKDERFSCLFLDITARKQAETWRVAAAELGDSLRKATTVLEIATRTAEFVGQILKGNRAGYGELDAACENVTILCDAVASGDASIVGRHTFADYGAVGGDIARGEPVIVNDVASDPRTAGNAATYAAINLTAMLNVPVQEHGCTVGLIFVHSPNARVWTSDDVTFARSVADRVQISIARLRAEEQLRLAISSTEIGVFDYDPVGGALIWDAGTRAMFGISPDQEVTYPIFLAAVHPDDQRWVDAAVQRALDPAGDGSYDITYRVLGVNNGIERWVNAKGQGLTKEGQVIRFIGTVRDVTTIKAAEAQQEVLNHELSHRLKNTLALVQAIARQTLKSAPDKETANKTLSSRLVALGRAHEILLTGRGESTDVQAIVAGALDLHDDGRPGRFVIHGPVVSIGEQAALSLSMVIHELATNATKYGALSTPDGQVTFAWSLIDTLGAKDISMSWEERGGPVVQAPMRKGFGSQLIERGLAGAIGGRVVMQYLPEGVVCSVTAPLAGMQSRS